MKATFYLLLTLFAIKLNAQVGINTQTPETTFDVVGKPNDTSHYDGIIGGFKLLMQRLILVKVGIILKNQIKHG